MIDKDTSVTPSETRASRHDMSTPAEPNTVACNRRFLPLPLLLLQMQLFLLLLLLSALATLYLFR